MNEFIRIAGWLNSLKTISYVISSTAMNVKSTSFTTLLNKLNAKRVYGFSVKVGGF